MAFELWDIESANLIGRYDSEARALAVVRGSLSRDRNDAVRAWELIRDVPEGAMETLASGEALVCRALGTVPA